MKQKNQNQDKALTPSSFQLEELLFINHKGEELDIRNVVPEFNITESLFTNSIELELGLMDTINMVESFPIIGQEKIKMKVKRVPIKGEEEGFEIEFFVTDYPMYGKPAGENIGVIKLKGISEHKFNNSFKTICRSYFEPTPDEIKKILTVDLEWPEDKFEVMGDDLSKSKGILNIQNPLSAIEFLRKTAFDESGTPFFFYQTIDQDGKIFYKSLKEMTDESKNPVHRKFFDARIFQGNDVMPDDGTSYEDKQKRLVSIASNLKLSKINQGVRGTFASENNYLDISSKTYTKFIYDYERDLRYEENTLEKKTILSSDYKIYEETLNRLPDAHRNYISTNDEAFEEDINYGSLSKINKFRTKAFFELTECFTHDIKVFGDFKLNPGKMIEIEVPRSVDPYITKQDDREFFDLSLSGKYLVTSVIHKFKAGEYFCDVRIKRDSFSLDI